MTETETKRKPIMLKVPETKKDCGDRLTFTVGTIDYTIHSDPGGGGGIRISSNFKMAVEASEYYSILTPKPRR